MEFNKKYHEIRKKLLSAAERNSSEKEVSRELVKLDDLLNEKMKELEFESQKYRVLFENAGDYIFVLSMEGKILEVNAAACKKYGISHKKFINTPILEIDASDNQAELLEKVDELLRTGSTRFEAVHKNHRGKKFNVDVVAQQIMWNNQPAVLDVCRDITLQKSLEKALNDSEIKLKKIINQIADGIIIFDRQGTIIIWNSGAENITGVKKEDAVGRLLYELQYEILHGPNKDMAFLKERFDEVVNKSNPEVFRSLVENEIFVPDKGVRTIQAKVFYIVLDNGTQLFGSVIRDITEQKQAETQLKNLLAAKDKIYSIIAHDLRTPFNSIIGFTDLLINNFDKYDRDKVMKILEFINLSSKPMLDVLTNMLNWVTAQTGHMAFNPEPLSLKDLVKEVVEMMKSSAEMKNIRLNQSIEHDFMVMADVNMLQSVLQNLLANAVKFSHPGGRIDVHARRKHNFVELEVADEGVGIDESKKNNLFRVDIHESSKGTSGEKGSGLGLILCKEFIEAHGGEIRVESQPGAGSRFMITVPLVTRSSKKSANS